ncbi:MAG: hypothetical protein RIQ99_1083, partial [Pseudomonadota bacterium]
MIKSSVAHRALAALLFSPFATVLAVTPARADAPTRTMAVQDLLTLKRISAPVASPDGQWVVYQQTDTDSASYTRTTGLWRIAAKNGAQNAAPQRIADLSDAAETSPAFSPDGKRLYFISDKSGKDQLWLLDLTVAGAAPVQASNFKADVAGFKLSPDGQRVLMWGDVARDCPTLGCDSDGNTALPGPGTGRLYQDGVGFVRHWDAWETPGNYSRGFAVALDAAGKVTGPTIALDGPAGTLTGDTPSKPMGGGEDLAWSADSKGVFFAARQADRNEPTSTNLDIWHNPLDGGAPHNLTAANRGTDTAPTPSPDGKWLAYAAMARAGYEADRLVVQLINLQTGEHRALTQGWDRSAGSIAWTPDSRALLVTAEDVMDVPAFRIDIASGKVDRLTLATKGQNEGHLSNLTPLADGRLLYTRDGVARPAEVFVAEPGKAGTALTHANDAQLAAMAPVVSQRFSFTGANGDTVWGQLHEPANAAGKLPVLLLVHGGPQGSFGDSWSFRWNPRLFAAQGYAVVAIDFHGSTGYGQGFTDAINRDWGGKPLEDLKLGLADALARHPELDGTNA